MTVLVRDDDFTLHQGDAIDVLPTLEAGSVDCVITSPPYWGLRDYGATGQLGLEPTPDEYVTRMVAVFRQVRRVLAPYGTCWVNIGDSYNGSGPNGNAGFNERYGRAVGQRKQESQSSGQTRVVPTLKPKDLVGIPWRLAFALQQDGWYLRADIIWAKPNPMPESVTDRPTKSHEYVFLLTKQPRYWFDQEAIREPSVYPDDNRKARQKPEDYTHRGRHGHFGVMTINPGNDRTYPSRNIRTVWEIATQPYPEAHFATYPEELVRRCLLAGCPEWVCRTCSKPRERIVERTPSYDHTTRAATTLADRNDVNGEHDVRHGVLVSTTTLGFSDCGHSNYRPGIVLDPFIGSGTTALVARNHGRHTIGIELSLEYAELAARRTQQLSLEAALAW